MSPQINVSFNDFDPNNLPSSVWATYIPSRRRGGSFKLHGVRGYAINAVVGEHQAKLYEFTDGAWQERAVFDKVALIVRAKAGAHCDVCRRPFDLDDKTRMDYNYHYARYPYQKFERDRRGKLVVPLRVLDVCGECVRGLSL